MDLQEHSEDKEGKEHLAHDHHISKEGQSKLSRSLNGDAQGLVVSARVQRGP